MHDIETEENAAQKRRNERNNTMNNVGMWAGGIGGPLLTAGILCATGATTSLLADPNAAVVLGTLAMASSMAGFTVGLFHGADIFNSFEEHLKARRQRKATPNQSPKSPKMG